MGTVTSTDSGSFLCTIHSDDANHQADNLINWQQEYDQLSQGRFLGVINEIRFPSVHVFREDSSHELRQQCRVEDGGLWLGFSANEKCCRINNVETTTSQFLCRPGSQDFELLTPKDFSIFGLVMHKELLDRFEQQGQEDIRGTIGNELWLKNVSPRSLMTFQHYLSILLQPDGNRWSSHTQEVILNDALHDLLEHVVQAKHPTSMSVSLHTRQKIMQRVNRYLTESRLKSPITISELCSAVHVSRRTLQYTFNQCCNMSPKQYIQIIRLNQIRRALLNNSNPQTVSEIAFDYGFFHLGQLSQDYKRLFAETPKQTRERIIGEQNLK